MNVTQAVLTGALREMNTVLASLEMAIMVTPSGSLRDSITEENIKALELRDSLRAKCSMLAADSDLQQKTPEQN